MQKNGGLTFLAGITQTIGGVTAVGICSAEGLLSNILLGALEACHFIILKETIV